MVIAETACRWCGGPSRADWGAELGRDHGCRSDDGGGRADRRRACLGAVPCGPAPAPALAHAAPRGRGPGGGPVRKGPSRTHRRAEAGSAADLAALQRAIDRAVRADELGLLETFPAIPPQERALGDLPGFAPVPDPGWVETYPVPDPIAPLPGVAPPPSLPNVESLPISEPDGPDYVQRRAREILLAEKGPPPPGMINPHGHHTLFQKGIGPRQQELVREGRAILEKHGIDPIFGSENLTWAPNVKGQHTTQALEPLVQELRQEDATGIADRESISRILEKYGNIAADRKPVGKQ